MPEQGRHPGLEGAAGRPDPAGGPHVGQGVPGLPETH